MTPAALTGAVAEAVAAAPADGGLGLPVPSDLALRPVAVGAGDYTCALPLQLAGAAARPAQEVAEVLAARLGATPGISRAAVGERGVLALTLVDTVALAAAVVAAGAAYGRSRALDGAHMTASIAGDLATAPDVPTAARRVKDEALARIAEAAGAHVTWTGQPDPGEVLRDGAARVEESAASEAASTALSSFVARGEEPALRYVLTRAPESTATARRGPVAQPPRAPGELAERHPGAPNELEERCRRVRGEAAFEVRYACAHAHLTLRHAHDLGVDPDTTEPGRFTDAHERAVLAAVAELPDRVALAARRRDVTVLTRHLETTAAAYHRLADTGRVLPRGPEPVTDMHRSRVLLTAAVRTTLAAGLAMLGVAVPDRM
ncbi:MAG: hypothetical protein GEV11_05190 [Streptosporangiales bacterium]|nr:hypothetical protein [Streptosporangiales bacterium]